MTKPDPNGLLGQELASARTVLNNAYGKTAQNSFFDLVKPIKELDDIKELIYSHIGRNLENTGVTQLLLAIAMPPNPTFLQTIGCLAQIGEEGIGTWDLALRQIAQECIDRGGLNQTL